MPYMIVKDGNQFCIHKKGEDNMPMGKSMGCHPTLADATKQMKAMYANEPKASTPDKKK